MRFALAAVILAFAAPVFAVEDEEGVDCDQRQSSQAGNNYCADKYEKAQKKAMEAVIAAIAKKQNPAAQNALKAQQADFLKKMNASCEQKNKAQQRGSAYIMLMATCRGDQLKARTAALKKQAGIK